MLFDSTTSIFMGSEGNRLLPLDSQIRKPRFLCLHGFRTSGLILQTQTGKWPQPVRDRLDLVFLDGAFPAEGKSDVEGIFDPPYYEWFQFNKEFNEYTNFDECLKYIEDYMVKHGPFDGFLGFSQGAILSAALPGLQAKGLALTKVPKIKIVIIVSGAKFRLESLAEKAYSSPIECPSLHFLGKEDFLRPHGTELLKHFVDPFVIHHPKGHTIPRIDPMDTMKDVLGKWGKKAAEAAKKTEVLAGDMWQHLKTSPSVADAAVGRIAQQTKVLTEGGYEKVYRQTFETLSDEKLKKCYACYLSTSAGPVMGILYLSTTKLAFCSDNPLSYQVGERTEWSYYKVVIPLHQLKAVNPSTSKVKPSEKYIQIISIDNHEFWFMGFVNYESAVKSLQGVIDERSL